MPNRCWLNFTPNRLRSFVIRANSAKCAIPKNANHDEFFDATMRLKNLMKARQSSDKYSEVQFLAEGRCEECLHNLKWYAENFFRARRSFTSPFHDKNSFQITP